MLEYICYGCIATYYCSFCAMAGYTCYQERQEERRRRLQEYQELSQENPPNIIMMSERQYATKQVNNLETIVEELEESF